MEVAFRETVREAKERGQTVFLSSHILSEVEALCDRVGILRAGRLVDAGHARRAPPPERADGRGDLRRARAGAARSCPASQVVAGGRERAPVRGHRQRRAADRGARGATRSRRSTAASRRSRRSSCTTTRARTAVARASAIARRAFADARVRTISFALLFAFASLTQATAYREGYPTLADRDRVRAHRRRQQRDAAALRRAARPAHGRRLRELARRREPGDLRGALGAARRRPRACAPRRTRAGPSSCSPASSAAAAPFVAQLAAIAAGAAVLWLATFVGPCSRAGSRPAGRPTSRSRSSRPCRSSPASAPWRASSRRPSAWRPGSATARARDRLRAARASPTPPETLGWLRWATPLGWAEELRPFADPQPLVLAAARAAAALLLARGGGRSWCGATSAAACCRPATARRRGSRLLGSPTAQALRAERGVLLAWLLGVGAFALLMGVLSDAVTPDVLSESVQRAAREARHGIDRHALGLARLRVPLLRARRQPLLLHAGRLDPRARRPSSGSRRCSRCRSAAGAGSPGGCCWRLGAPRPSRSRPACSPGPAPPPQGADVSLADLLGGGREHAARRAALPRPRRARLRACPARERARSPTGSSPSRSSGSCSARCSTCPAGCSRSRRSTTSASSPPSRSSRSGAAVMLAIALVLAVAAVALFARRDLT